MYLYDIIRQYRSLVDQFNEAETEEEAEQILAQIELVDATFEDKIEALTKAWKNIESIVPGLKDEIARLSTIKSRVERRVERLKELIKNAIQVAGRPEPKVKTAIGTVRIQRNSQASVTYTGEPKDLPLTYRTLVPASYVTDSKAIQDAFKNYEKQLAEALENDPELDRHAFYLNWLQSEGLPESMIVDRGHHVRLQ